MKTNILSAPLRKCCGQAVLMAVAEGAISKEDSLLTKKELKAKLANRKYPSISYQLAEEL